MRSTAISKFNSHSVATAARSCTSAALSLFNKRGVITSPMFTLRRPTTAGVDIEFTVRGHRVENDLWIAQPTWVCRSGSIPLDGIPLHEGSRGFRSRSEAVADAMSRGLRMARKQKHRNLGTQRWNRALASLAAWMAEAMEAVRAEDETLPLRGLVGIDLLSGGQGALSEAMVSQGIRIDLACEIDPPAREAYLQNFRPRVMHDDICTLDARRLNADIVTMGLMCQAFSVAGNGLGFDDPALALAYMHAIRVLCEIRAKVLIIECARQFMTLDGGKHSDELIERLMLAGYRVQHRALNAAGFGAPQSRERSFLVGTRIGLDVDDIVGVLFPEEQEPSACVEDILDDGVPTISDADIVSHGDEPVSRVGKLALVGRVGGRNSQGYRVYSTRGLGATLTASGGGRAPCTGAYRVPGGARALTPREAYRMQGMPEWSEHHPNERQALRHAGNAVAVPVARELIRSLGSILGGRS